MARMLFDPPIYVTRRCYIEEIACLDDALAFLEGWPDEHRDIIYDTVLRACSEAYIGKFPFEAVHEAFRRFALKAGVLTEIETRG